MTGVAPTALLDPSLLAGIGDLELLARTVVDGFLHGAHRSRQKGLSLDFAEHRLYQPGDDLRRIDWRVYARTDRFYLKTFEAESNADLRIALDVSRSMDFGSGAMTKFDWARAMVASLAWLAQRQGDRIGYVPLGGDGAEIIPPSARHLPLVLQAMARTTPTGTRPVAGALEALARVGGKAGMLVVATDCYDEPERIQHALGTLRARGHDVMLFHVVDPAERDFPYEAPVTFADLESEARLAVQPADIAAAYRAAFAAHGEAVARGVGAAGGDYVRVSGDAPLDGALRAWLAHRRRPELAR
ncbi:MAG TPA: DUF58 domain-containing protein [Gemmatimonadales bacterium]|nr:DUF58 domain-containing protein [Gemmatimonadales bacterium]HRX19575.1 DUF58 domain-containing protein [Gemmatimonadales bacterium]